MGGFGCVGELCRILELVGLVLEVLEACAVMVVVVFGAGRGGSWLEGPMARITRREATECGSGAVGLAKLGYMRSGDQLGP